MEDDETRIFKPIIELGQEKISHICYIGTTCYAADRKTIYAVCCNTQTRRLRILLTTNQYRIYLHLEMGICYLLDMTVVRLYI